MRIYTERLVDSYLINVSLSTIVNDWLIGSVMGQGRDGDSEFGNAIETITSVSQQNAPYT